MLVLSRKAKETILIGGDIRLTVIAIRESETRLGIEAPGDVVILRGELDPSRCLSDFQARHPRRATVGGVARGERAHPSGPTDEGPNPQQVNFVDRPADPNLGS